MHTETPPWFVLVDDDPAALEALGEALERRYGRDYLVLRETSAAIALERLTSLRDRDAEVALLIADQWMPEMTGVDFLTRAHDLHPRAKRALLTEALDQRAADAILQATALGRADHYLVKPWTPPDDLLHPLIAELLAEWTRSHRPRLEIVRIVADRWDARSHELRDLFDRNNIPFGFYPQDSEAGRALLREAGVAGERFPVVMFHSGQVLVQPSNVEIAEVFGVQTSASAEPCDLAIIGAGPAGLAAAVYGGSEGLRTTVVERQAMGGQAGTSSMIRNYLGFPRGISGNELAQRAYSQAWLFGVQFVWVQEAIGLRDEGEERRVTLTGGSEIRARAVVLATGVTYRRMGVPSIERLLGAGVFYGAAASEAKAMQGQRVCVVGAGNSAGQAAVHLAKFADRVTLLARGDSLSATMSDYLVKELERTKNLEVRLNTQVVAAHGEQRLEGLLLQDARTGQPEEVSTVALFILIGAVPHTSWLEGVVARDPRGFILTGADLLRDERTPGRRPLERPPHLLETSLPGVFAVGDVRHRSIKRVASAVGEGSICISFVHQYLNER